MDKEPKISVAGIAVKNKKLFIARRTGGGDMGGVWEFPGGKVEEGEDCTSALAREFLEEFNVKTDVMEALAQSEFIHNGIKYILKSYRIVLRDRDFTLTEHDEWKWASHEEIKNLFENGKFTPSDFSLLPEIIKKLEL